MAIIDLDNLLQEVSADLPSGDDLEYDPLFSEMERAAQGKPERQMGDVVEPAEDPNWREVKNKAIELFSRTKDLRVSVCLARALVHTDGVVGLSEGLALIKVLLEKYWETLHPQLDPDDDNDPTMRVNTLASLCAQEEVLHSIRLAPLVQSRAFGQFNLRDISIATGQQTPPAEMTDNIPDEATINAAFMECDLEELQATAVATQEALDHVNAIELVVTDKVGVASAISLRELVSVLKEVQHALNERLEQRGIVSTDVEDEVSEPGEQSEKTNAQSSSPGVINTTEDVVRAIDKICDYYARNEPSSPVPLVLKRAKRLVAKDFMEIMQDLAPDSVPQVETVTGAQTDDSSSW